MEVEEQTTTGTAPNINVGRLQRTPTFFKVQRGDPYILTQKSRETISSNNNDGASYDDGDTAGGFLCQLQWESYSYGNGSRRRVGNGLGDGRIDDDVH
jgi:hypothetical protein